MLTASLFDTSKARADFDAFHCVDAHHRVCDIGVESIEYRLAKTWR
jgi:hypothetical protein